jgi:GNAT superfamily N-acetyltransferase
MDPPTIADFGPETTLELVQMWRASFEHGVGVVDPHPIAEQIDYFETRVLPHYRVRVARAGPTIVGFVAADALSVVQLFVRVGHHGRGIGSRLLDCAKAGSTGTLWLYTFARNTVARRFYAKHGFRETAWGFEPFWQLDDVRLEWTRPDGQPQGDGR